MKKFRNHALAILAILSQFVGSYTMAAVSDVAVGSLNISGNVPVVFSLTTRGIPGDLD